MADGTSIRASVKETSSGAALQLRLTPLPANGPLLHDAQEARRILEDELRLQKMLRVALGYSPDSVAHIKLFPLDRLVLPSQSDPSYARSLTAYLKMKMENDEKEQKVMTVTLSAWTTLTAALALAAEPNRPSLARSIRHICELSNDSVYDGYFDGPRAFTMVMHDLAIITGERSKRDKAFYEDALSVQVSHRLQDGSSADDYRKKAEAFVEKIKPFLPRVMEPYDAMEYLLDLMPTATLKIHRRQLINEFKAENQVSNSSHIIDECYKVVQEDQKHGSTKALTLAAVPAKHTYSMEELVSLQDTCGISLDLGEAKKVITPFVPNGELGKGKGGGGKGNPHGGKGTGGKGGPGGDKKWCDQCTTGGGHPNVRRPNAPLKPCVSNPYFAEACPPGIYCVPEKKAAVEAKRDENAKSESARTGKTVTAKPLVAPPQSDIDSWKTWRAEMDLKYKKKETAGGVAIDAGQLSNFYQTLQDVDDASFGLDVNLCAYPLGSPGPAQGKPTQLGTVPSYVTDDEIDRQLDGLNVSACALAGDTSLRASDTDDLHMQLRTHQPSGPSDSICIRSALSDDELQKQIAMICRARSEPAMRNLFLDASYTGDLPSIMPKLYFKAGWVAEIVAGKKTEEARVLEWHFRGDNHESEGDKLQAKIECRPANQIKKHDWVVAIEPGSLVTIFEVADRRIWQNIAQAWDEYGDALIPPSLQKILNGQAANSYYQTMFNSTRGET